MKIKFPKGLIVSCQSDKGSWFDNQNSVLSFAKEAERSGAVGLRIKDSNNVKVVRKHTSLPIIGLTKSYYDGTDLVLITPTYNDMVKLKNAGASYVAVDATGRNGYEHIMMAKTELGIDIIGDLSDIKEAEQAIASGCSMFTTALSGYAGNNEKFNKYEPDFKLLELLVSHFQAPVLAEGRFWTLDHVKRALDIGAHAIVIGSAITRPHHITEYFNSVF